MLGPLAEAGIVRTTLGIDRDPANLYNAEFVFQYVDHPDHLAWQTGSWSELLQPDDQFDLVVSAPALGLPAMAYPIQSENGTRIVRLLETGALVLNACLRLTADGEAIFVLPSSFFFRTRAARDLLAEHGVHPHAAIALPRGAFSPWTVAELDLVFLRRGAPQSLFAGQLTPYGEADTLIRNLHERRIGKVPELGLLIEPSQFTSWGGHA